MNKGNEQRGGQAASQGGQTSEADEKLEQNLDRSRAEATVPAHMPDPAERGEENKVVGEASPHFRDYNDPPPEGASKSTGDPVDPGVGGALGQPPGPADGFLPIVSL